MLQESKQANSSRRRRPYIRTETHKRNISLALTGRKHTSEHIENNRLSHLGKRHTEGWKQEHSRQLKGRKLTLRQRLNISKATRGIRKSHVPPRSIEHRRKIGEANRRRWLRPGFAEKVLEKIRQHTRPTEPEKHLDLLLSLYFPNEWSYVGDGKVIIERKNPDFINRNGKKLIIELFGDYWHDASEAEDRMKFFKKYGFRCLIIWQSELKEPKTVVKRVREFSDGE